MNLSSPRIARAALLLVGGVLPLTIANHWFRTDDYLLLEAASRTPPWRVWEFFGAGGVFFWRPLQSWLMSILWSVGGLNPVLYNLALLGGWVAALWQFERLAFELTSDERAGLLALAAAIAFAPATTMMCVWVSLLGAAWGTVLALLGMRWWLRVMRGEASRGRAVAAAALLACAILFKESLSSAIVLVPVLLCAISREQRTRAARSLAFLAIPMLAAVTAALVSSRATSGAEDITRYYPRAPIVSMPGNLGAMLNTIVWPLAATGSLLDSPLHQFSRAALSVWPLLPIVIALLALWKRSSACIVGLAWAVIGCFPAALLVNNLDSRYLHWPAFGVALCVGALLSRIAAKPERALALRMKIATAGLLTGFLALSLMTWTVAMRAIADRGEVGRALHQSLAHATLPAGTTLILLDNVSSKATNGGLGLSALARLTLQREDIACELASLYDDAGWRAKFDSEFAHILQWRFDGGRFEAVAAPKP